MDMNYDDDEEREERGEGYEERLRREYGSSEEEEEDHVPPPEEDDEEEDDENEFLSQQTDQNILSVLKVSPSPSLSSPPLSHPSQKLEEISQECGDISSYKKNTRELFEQLLLKLEENNDQIYSLHHRIKYLEQECGSKDIHIEKITIAMQEAVDDCRVEAEELVEEMSKKVSAEVFQRQETERIICRLQVENSQLKVRPS